MDVGLVVDNLLTAPVLFFGLGAAATLVRSDLEVPQPIRKALSLYLLLAIGFKGGVELAESGVQTHVLTTLAACVGMAAAIPVWTFYLLRRRVDVADAAAIAATYGSISAVTFIIATDVLRQQGIAFGGHMVAGMALMESPAIVVGVVLMRHHTPRETSEGESGGGGARQGWGKVLHEAFLNGAVVLLMGSLFIGMVTGHRGFESVKPFIDAPFKGVLCLFLLDLGLIASRRAGGLKRSGPLLVGFAIIGPVVHALMGIAVAKVLGLGVGDALLLAILCGSASYIAVPACARLVMPPANPGLFVPMALAVTFPFNVAIGIPLYLAIIKAWIGGTS